jgi:hypothetical protein
MISSGSQDLHIHDLYTDVSDPWTLTALGDTHL